MGRIKPSPPIRTMADYVFHLMLDRRSKSIIRRAVEQQPFPIWPIRKVTLSPAVQSYFEES